MVMFDVGASEKGIATFYEVDNDFPEVLYIDESRAK